MEKLSTGLVVALGIIFLLGMWSILVFLKRENDWERRPKEVKEATLRLEKQLRANLQQGDFIRLDGKLEFAIQYYRGEDRVTLRACLDCLNNMYPVRDIARQGAVLIPRTDQVTFARAAVEFLKP